MIGTLLKDQPYAADVYRYFLLREIPFGQDGSFSEEAIFTRLSADLANDLGNLVNRTLSMVDRYCHGRLPAPAAIGCAVDDEPLRRSAVGLVPTIEEAMGRVEFSEALEAIMRLVTQANRYIEVAAPWKLAKEADGAHRLHAVLNMLLHAVLNMLAEVTRVISITLEPFMPSVAQAMWQQLGCGRATRRLQDAKRWPGLASGQAIGPHPVLFPRSDSVSTP
ncbi:MAG: class I tRNA ligase family protein [Candidatus Omnitrophica bacterium]|nr:class I tRNA ligase family protein [Candidatus Omnitrophota bacterium]